MARVYLGLGANVGDRRANLRAALSSLAPLVRTEVVSSLYETPSLSTPEVGDQPDFLNAVVRATTTLRPDALLRHIKTVERDAGRRPGLRWGPRPLDIDILLYDDQQLESDELTIPHAGLFERIFVLAPLAELAPDLPLPGGTVTVAQALAALPAQEIARLEGPQWAGLES